MSYRYETHLHTCQGSACASATGGEMARVHKNAGYSGIFITDHKLYPIQAILRQILMSSEFNNLLYDDGTQNLPSEMLKCAMIAITALPIICVYPFLQRYFVKGIMVGSVKG